MSHPRTVIRTYVVNAIKAANTAAGQEIYSTVTHPTDAALAVSVSTPLDQVVGSYSDAPLILKRDLSLNITITAAGAGCEDVANDLADELELLLLDDPTLGENCELCRLRSTSIDLDGAGAETAAEAELSFSVIYSSQHGAVAPDEFLTASADWDTGPDVDGQIDAQDTIDIPQ